MTHIIQFTTVHPRTDVRIRIKEVASLHRHLDARVDLFVQDGLGDEIDATHGFVITDTGARPKGRLARMTKGAWRMFRAVRQAGPDVAHFHDPELIPVGLLLRLSGIKVIYDVHEDLPRQVLNKVYLRPWLRGGISKSVAAIEWVAGRAFNGVSAAVPSIAARFPRDKTILVRNFPAPEDITTPTPRPYADRPAHFTYIGGLTEVRGTLQMVAAMDLVSDPSARLQLAGKFQQQSHRAAAEATPGWAHVDDHGWLDRIGIADLLSNARAGMVVLHPTPSHVDSLPVKFFEYMAAGLPVISSDFPMLREIIEKTGCGLIADPMDPASIAKAMTRILSDPQAAAEMGARGKEAVAQHYNWHAEARTLIAFYHDRLGIPLRAQPTA